MPALALVGCAAWTLPAAHALSCSTESSLPAPERTALIAEAKLIGDAAAAGTASAVKAETIPVLTAQFDPVAATIADLAPATKGAAVTIESVYALHAADLKPGASSEAQFFCSVAGSDLLVTVTIPDLAPGEYAIAIVHASGVAHPQQFALVLEKMQDKWKLAGFSAKPLLEAGHDGLWYWTEARAHAKKQERWSAYFYYQVAEYLLNPADFFGSPNLSKLEKEETAVRPDNLPGDEPMTVAAGDAVYTITGLRTDGSLGGLDLVVQEKVASVADPVATRAAILSLMQALLAQHAELRGSFHGLWVYASAPGSQPFAIELPMAQIPAG